MGFCLSTPSRPRSANRIGQGTISDEHRRQSPHTVSIHILDDDSLLNMFCLYRPYFLGEETGTFERVYGGEQKWVGGRWWYKLAHVCQRWRNLILGSASYLRLSLVCTNGTPVANMLAHSPPLPLTVDYRGDNGITIEDEEGVTLALEQRNRVRHFRLHLPVYILQKLVVAIDGEFPILEYLIVMSSIEDSTTLMLRKTLQTPHLKHFMLQGFTCPMGPRLHPSAEGLVTLELTIEHPSAYFQPNILLQWISFMPQLEALVIAFRFPVPNRDVERQLTHTPITTPITLPNLRWIWFEGVSAYIETIICQITIPRIEKLYIAFFKQLTFSVPRLVQFMNTTENLRFDTAVLDFSNKRVRVETYLHETGECPLSIRVDSWHLDWQVSSMAQISNALSQAFSMVEHLSLKHKVHSQSSEERNVVDCIEWRNLLRSFSNVKTLNVEDGLVEELSRCLRLEDGEELPPELLPELQELKYFGSGDAGDIFTSFINACQNAGRPVTLVRLGPSPSLLPFDAPAMTSASGEAGNDLDT